MPEPEVKRSEVRSIRNLQAPRGSLKGGTNIGSRGKMTSSRTLNPRVSSAGGALQGQESSGVVKTTRPKTAFAALPLPRFPTIYPVTLGLPVSAKSTENEGDAPASNPQSKRSKKKFQMYDEKPEKPDMRSNTLKAALKTESKLQQASEVNEASRGVAEFGADMLRDAVPSSMCDASLKGQNKVEKCFGTSPHTKRRPSRDSGGFSFYRRLKKDDMLKNEIKYEVEHPPKVATRLEKLMGHTTAYLNSVNYIHHLHQAITNEEEHIYDKARMAREEKEKARVNKLVMEGLMEPPPEMEDLKNHPYFKMNRMMANMKALEETWSLEPIDEKITPVEPFEFGDTGEYFSRLHEGMHPVSAGTNSSGSHGLKKRPSSKWSMADIAASRSVNTLYSEPSGFDILNELNSPTSPDDITQDEIMEDSQSLTREEKQKELMKELERKEKPKEYSLGSENVAKQDKRRKLEEVKTKKLLQESRLRFKQQEESLREDDTSGSLKAEGENDDFADNLPPQHSESVAFNIKRPTIQRNYSHPESPLISRYLDDAPDAASLFKSGKEILDVHVRENEVADDFLKKLNKLMDMQAQGQDTKRSV